MAVINGNPAAYIAMSRFPHPKVKNITSINRLVVLPDYQGIGLGKKLLDSMCELYKDEGNRPRIVTSQPALINGLKRCPKWACTHIGRKVSHTGGLRKKGAHTQGSGANRITASFEYIGGKNQ